MKGARGRCGLLVLGLCLGSQVARAQSADEVQARVGATVKKRLSKRWAMALNPEIRTDELRPERYLLEATLGYHPVRYLGLKAWLRGDVRDDPDLDAGVTDYGARAGLSTSGELPFGDFKAEGRVFYTYNFGPLREERHRLRYRLTLRYDVPHVPLDVEAGVELFQRLESGALQKLRFSLELSYAFQKSKETDQFVCLGYMLDDRLEDGSLRHMPTLSYKLHF